MTFLQTCRELNVWLGLLAAVALGYRAVIGIARSQLMLKPLFLEFAAAMFLVGVGSKVAQNNHAPTTWVTACWTFLLAAIVLTAIFHNPKGKPHG